MIICPSGKIPYTSRRDALLVRQRMGGNVEPYVCRSCGCYHLGHRNVWKRIKREMRRNA